MADQDPETASRPDRGDLEGTDETEKRVAHYLRMLSDGNPANRWKAAESLGRLGDVRAVEPLIAALFDEDPRVRMKVAWALGSLGDIRALAPLQQLYRMEKENVKEIIERATAEIKQQTSRQ